MKKELFLPLIIFALTLVFAVICLMVYLSKGNAYWIKRKLKIGALLLTFTWITNSCEKVPPVVECYMMPPKENTIWINSTSDSMKFNLSDTMFVQIQNATYPFFSFDILDESLNSKKSGILQKYDDSLNYGNMYFIVFQPELDLGKYQINFYGETEEVVTKQNKIISYDFWIK
jgi:hypothetical protein